MCDDDTSTPIVVAIKVQSTVTIITSSRNHRFLGSPMAMRTTGDQLLSHCLTVMSVGSFDVWHRLAMLVFRKVLYYATVLYVSSEHHIVPSNLAVGAHHFTLRGVVSCEKRSHNVQGPVEGHCKVDNIGKESCWR